MLQPVNSFSNSDEKSVNCAKIEASKVTMSMLKPLVGACLWLIELCAKQCCDIQCNCSQSSVFLS